uniref:Uncharacterized protein n=1 Tax=Octopus bimaculoides TaxID=37653 RepID=A0A0L8G8G7_OCTBM
MSGLPSSLHTFNCNTERSLCTSSRSRCTSADFSFNSRILSCNSVSYLEMTDSFCRISLRSSGIKLLIRFASNVSPSITRWALWLAPFPILIIDFHPFCLLPNETLDPAIVDFFYLEPLGLFLF